MMIQHRLSSCPVAAVLVVIAVATPWIASARPSLGPPTSCPPPRFTTTAFASTSHTKHRPHAHPTSPLPTALHASSNDQQPPPSFLSTKTATVQFTSNQPANLSAVDSLLLILTSDRFSLLMGSLGIALLLLNRLFTFPEGDEALLYEGSRSRVDLLGVFAAGSVLLNGITKLDVTSVTSARVALEGINFDRVLWVNRDTIGRKEVVERTEWVLASLIKCSPTRTAVLLSNSGEEWTTRWEPIAMMGVLPFEEKLRHSIPDDLPTPILDRMKRYDAASMNAKGGSVAGASALGRDNMGPKESYLPTLQALPGRVEFSYLPSNTQEVLVLPVPTKTEEGGRCFAVVLGGDAAKSFAPKDVAWCREISAWIGDAFEENR